MSRNPPYIENPNAPPATVIVHIHRDDLALVRARDPGIGQTVVLFIGPSTRPEWVNLYLSVEEKR